MTPFWIVATRSILAVLLLVGTARPLAAELVVPEAEGEPETIDPDAADSEARRLYQEGLDLYRRGDYDAAITKLAASYGKMPAPGLLYDLAQAHRLKQDCPRALEHYRRFIASGPTGTLRDRTLARIGEMERCVASTPAPVPVSVPEPVSVPPPAVVPTITTLSQPVAPPVHPNVLIAVRGDTRGPDALARHLHRHRTAAIVGGATTLALASLSGYFAWRTNDASSDVSATFRPGSHWDSTGIAAEQRGQTSYKLEIGAALGTLIAGGISTWLIFRD